jgi:undecaprenyl-diphosphatase
MNFLEAIILGLIQGLTEFIPVSSSGHLLLVHEILGKGSLDLAVDAVLQLATVLAVLIFFRNEIASLSKSFVKLITRKEVEATEKTLLYAMILGTLPAILLGIILEGQMETLFRNSHLVAYALLAGSALMYLAEKIAKQNGSLTASKGLLIGVFQALALVPGVSRSGVVISGGLLAGLSREAATRFGFLLSFPIIAISGIKKLMDLYVGGEIITLGMPLVVSFLISFVVGLWAIGFLIKYLKNNSLNIFILYRILLAVGIFFFI